MSFSKHPIIAAHFAEFNNASDSAFYLELSNKLYKALIAYEETEALQASKQTNVQQQLVNALTQAIISGNLEAVETYSRAIQRIGSI